MRRWVLVLVLMVAPATVWAESAPTAITQKASDTVAAIEKRVGQLAIQRQGLNQKLAEQQRAAAELKQQKPSWRRDRELRDQLAEEHETATQLAAVSAQLDKAQGELAAARRGLIAAIDAEIAAGASGPRAQQLAAWRKQLAPQVASGAAPRKIVVPDTKIDPLADPEELDEQAAALREAEGQLARQVAQYDAQGKELDRIAALHRQHDRAIEMDRRDDNNSRRSPQQPTHTSGGITEANDSPAPPTGAGQSPPPTDGGGGTGPSPSPSTTGAGGRDFAGSLDNEARTVLGDVVDPTTLDALAREARSSDPAKRADAAKKLRDAVANKLAQIRAGRTKIEQRAKQLRGQ
jgi:hypothetical protein